MWRELFEYILIAMKVNYLFSIHRFFISSDCLSTHCDKKESKL